MTPTKSMTLGYLNKRKGDIWVVNDLALQLSVMQNSGCFSAVFSLREKKPLIWELFSPMYLVQQYWQWFCKYVECCSPLCHSVQFYKCTELGYLTICRTCRIDRLVTRQ